jgi:anti-sigma-K factor RskA
MVAIRNGSRPIPIDMAFKIAITLQLDPAEVVADIEEQREKNPKRRDFWRSFLSRAALVIATVACTLALNFSAISGAGAERLGGSKNRRFNYA